MFDSYNGLFYRDSMTSNMGHISHSASHYMRVIHDLIEEKGYARIVDISRILKRTRGTVSVVVRRLERRGLIRLDENKFIHLSNRGYKLSSKVIDTKHVLTDFFYKVLRLPKKIADKEACGIENHLSEQTMLAFERFLKRNQYAKT